MTTVADWKKDRQNFLRLLTDFDDTSDIPVAIRLDLTRDQAKVMAPGVEDFEELRLACATWVQNWLAPEIERLHSHLIWKAMGGR